MRGKSFLCRGGPGCEKFLMGLIKKRATPFKGNSLCKSV